MQYIERPEPNHQGGIVPRVKVRRLCQTG